MKVLSFFGTPDGMPAILWGFGTGAVYSHVKTPMTLAELSERFKNISGEETLDKKLYILGRKEIQKLSVEPDVHPQTQLVVPTMIALFGNK